MSKEVVAKVKMSETVLTSSGQAGVSSWATALCSTGACSCWAEASVACASAAAPVPSVVAASPVAASPDVELCELVGVAEGVALSVLVELPWVASTACT